MDSSRHRVPRVLPNLRDAKTEDDVLGRNASFLELVRKTFLSAVVLDPHFVADQVNVGNRAVDALVSAPARSEERRVGKECRL